ncbi:dynamin family protein [Staphylococcus hominis]|uniref:dynamin family protein n=1 Tax=Staphylococcus hominis TaxID=1290 RepID=UPI001FEE98DD|nr:dynamin family protein [Staphylococcus hominis]MCI3142875.1 dynamin family protein [Staphylococcus hominis subsp. hominis]
MPLKLKEFREEMLEINQEELSNITDIDLEDIKAYESGLKPLSEEISREIILKTDVDVFDVQQDGYYFRETKYMPWIKNEEDISEINNKIDEKIEYYNDMLINLKHNQLPILNSSISKDFNNRKIKVISNMLDEIKKPSLTLFGASSSGKSTMINHILGDKTLPTSWTPTTSVATKIVHSDDKPDYLGESEVAIFKTSIHDNDLIETHKLYDREYFNQHLITKGDLNLIEEFGKHGGKKYEEFKIQENRYNYTIVCYLNKPILKLCDVWDIPGINAEKIDDDIAETSKNGADITLYLSKASQFMQNYDRPHVRSFFKQSLKFSNRYEEVGLFENVFIIASQANEVKRGVDSVETIEEIIDKRIKEFYETFDNKHIVEDSKSQFNYSSIKNRAFDFDVETPKAQSKVKNELIKLLNKVSSSRLKVLENYEKELFKEYNKEILTTISQLKEMNDAKKQLEDFLANKEDNLKKNEELVEAITKEAQILKNETLKDIKYVFYDQINIENVYELIEEKNFGKKRQDQERFAEWFQAEIEYQIDEVIKKNSDDFSEKINKKLEYIAENEQYKSKVSGFNFAANFIGGLSSLATVGAFSVYFSTLGNLGGYIFISQAVSVLSSLGISLGGTATVASAISVVGGPMTVVAGIALIAGMAIRTFISKTAWKKDLAKKIVKSYDKKIKPKSDKEEKYRGFTLKEIFLSQAEKYWNDTIEALDTKLFEEQLEKTENELREKAADGQQQEKIAEELKTLLFSEVA